MRPSLATLLLLAALGACTSTQPPSSQESGLAPTPTPDQRAAVPTHLSVERQWLSSWFKGTPVRIRQVEDDAIAIEVPLGFCFDPGKTVVKPALGAVLDKMTQSLHRFALANVTLIAAPADGKSNPDLALKRAAQIHEHLRAAGVRAERLGKPSIAAEPAVLLRMEASPL